MRYLRLLTSCAAACAALLPGAVFSQGTADAYPSKPVMVIVPYATGGPVDREGRLYSAKLSKLMGQQFVVDSKPGAGTTIGTAYVARAKPDGYTLLVVAASFTTFPAVYKELPFDTMKDFAPVSLVSKRAIVLVAHPAFPAKTFPEYVAYARANPGKINFGTSGAGGVSHLGGAWLHGATNTKVTFVHYKGTGALMPDLLAGRLDVTPAAFLVSLSMIKSGKLRALALMNKERSDLLPGVPTIAEQGIPGYDYASWTGFIAPAATPAAIVNKLSEALAKVAKDPDVVAMLAGDGGMPVGGTPAQFRQFLVAETDRWRKVARDGGIKLEQ